MIIGLGRCFAFLFFFGPLCFLPKAGLEKCGLSWCLPNAGLRNEALFLRRGACQSPACGS